MSFNFADVISNLKLKNQYNKMKKLLGLLLFAAAMFSSCGNDLEDLYDPHAAALLKANKYSKAFVQQFGAINPNHTWGFSGLMSRGADQQSNQWYSYVTLPDRITPAEEEKVTAYFQNTSNYSKNTQVDFSDFFVQQVHKGTTEYTVYDYTNGENTNGTIVGSDKMDQLSVGTDLNNIEAVPNFNAGGKASEQRVQVSNDQNDVYYEGIAMMVDSHSSFFAYKNSQVTNGVALYYDYIVLEIDGSYYVGFDYKCESNDAFVKADGVYDDWIVKITPVRYNNVYRIIAEDLGDTDDFDFNDVVFDVKFVYRWENNVNDNVAEITLIAAGGTLPLSICYGDQEVEVHEMFGVNSNVMVNTGAGASANKVTFDLIGCTNLNDIKVKVGGQEAAYYLKAEVGKAPQMLCVGTDYVPTKERQGIDEKYPKFKEYVNNPAVKWY